MHPVQVAPALLVSLHVAQVTAVVQESGSHELSVVGLVKPPGLVQSIVPAHFAFEYVRVTPVQLLILFVTPLEPDPGNSTQLAGEAAVPI